MLPVRSQIVSGQMEMLLPGRNFSGIFAQSVTGGGEISAKAAYCDRRERLQERSKLGL